MSETRMTNRARRASPRVRHSGFVIRHSFGFRVSSFELPRRSLRQVRDRPLPVVALDADDLLVLPPAAQRAGLDRLGGKREGVGGGGPVLVARALDLEPR